MWTMTQGHEPHGDGGGREELLIRACGISYGYHRTDSVLPPMAAAQPPSSRHRCLGHRPNASQPRFIARERSKGGVRVSQGSDSHRERFIKNHIKSQSGHLGVS